jgi:hypothetical protein
MVGHPVLQFDLVLLGPGFSGVLRDQHANVPSALVAVGTGTRGLGDFLHGARA